MSIEAIERYYKSNVYKPFYMAVGDEEYRYLKKKLVEVGDIVFVRLSSCCPVADKKPDMDKLREILRMADVDCDSNKIVVLGLGEYLALEGVTFARKILNELITFNLGSAHVVFLLRGVTAQLREMVGDPRYAERQIEIGAEAMTGISFMFSSLDLGMYEETGFMRALEIAEDGDMEMICANTSMSFQDSICSVQVVSNPYEAIRRKIKGFDLPQNIGSNDYWEELLKDINRLNSLSEVFKSHGFNITLGDFYQNISSESYSSWLYYVYLIENSESLNNEYLRFVLKNSSAFEDFKYKILNAIIAVSHDAEEFPMLYADRKRLVKQYPSADIAVFVSNNRVNPQESIYKLTDNTLVECEEIIANIAQHGFPRRLETIYPALAMYLQKFHFQGDAISDLLTDYFEEYKQQKVLNTLNPDFLVKVDDLAQKRVFNRLRTRDEIISGIDSEGTFLRWVDALGVEYLSFIVEKAHQRGLAVSVCVGRADLPTITGINRKFYDEWPEDRRQKVEDLDGIDEYADLPGT